MTAQALLNTARELLAGDRETRAMAQSTATCSPWSATAGIAQETGGQADELASARWDGEGAKVMATQHALRDYATCDQMARRGARSAARERTAA